MFSSSPLGTTATGDSCTPIKQEPCHDRPQVGMSRPTSALHRAQEDLGQNDLAVSQCCSGRVNRPPAEAIARLRRTPEEDPGPEGEVGSEPAYHVADDRAQISGAEHLQP